MKVYDVLLDDKQVESMFKPVRDRKQVVELLLSTMRLFLLQPLPRPLKISGLLELRISKMSRLFFFSENKHFSIAFPFIAKLNDDGVLAFYNDSGFEISSKTLSEITAIIDSGYDFDNGSFIDFYDSFEESLVESPNFWTVFLKLMTFEEGYIRYDYDEEHENGDLHPLNHLDIFYSSKPTFKIGLRGRYQKDYLVNLVNRETNCVYLDK
ncbi:TPA: hypothetical protein ACQ7HD_005314 [Klebsiella pneumoniae]|uniref:hypothetical protein n=1 Tax=Enterobacteriaceae TaxID=543 RepID=UPI00067F0A1D|nr:MULTISPECIES: hypothetical protein [Enterobacteriaceae]EKC7220137.1 hypothetical protein [Salmonella enterica]HAV1480755.1 hypothetical protein [Enterobacter hormaechei subsp. steigerwaltii]HCB0503192.1 hypothetical protein [Klebsiella variicola subsp. variicola]HDX8854386.1 hypothetical protein [Klebsiella michiganensis]EKZ5775085.1 hypothetical protein [Klebsiella pneumoniae]